MFACIFLLASMDRAIFDHIGRVAIGTVGHQASSVSRMLLLSMIPLPFKDYQ
jgi:hypothetical protein